MAVSTHETRFLLTGKDKTKVAFKSVKGNLKTVGGAVTGLHTKLLALAGVGGLGALVKGIVDTNIEIQTLKSSLKTVTGSAENADKAFKQITEFAKTTPYDLKQVTEGFIKLKALGLDPSEAAMRSYGNTAAAMGKDMNQMIEAIADAATGEFERLKEFGIKAKKQRDQVSFTFQGITTTVKNNADEITKYLKGIGNNQFGSAMADQMNNMKPAISNMNAAFTGLSIRIGELGLNDFIRDAALEITDFVDSFDTVKINEIMTLLNGIADGFGVIGDVAGSITDVIGSIWATGDATSVVPSGIGGGVNGYQLGDFNGSSRRGNSLSDEINRRQNYEKLKENLQQKYAPDQIEALKKGFEPQTQETKKTNALLEKNNQLLGNLAGALEGSVGYAVAG